MWTTVNVVWMAVGDQGFTASVWSWETKTSLLKSRL